MNQLETLLKYQETDLEVDQYEAELKKSPLRQKLVKLRNYLMNAQKRLDQMEEDLKNLTESMSEISSDFAQVRIKKAAIAEAAGAVDPEDIDAIGELMQKNERLFDDIEYYEKQLVKARDEAADINEKQHEIVTKAVKAKTDYTQMKSVYDEQYKEASEKLEELKNKRNEAAKPIDTALLERYKYVKSHRVPPIALLSNDQCMGCNMSLPSVVTRSAQQGNIIECENCGRILYTTE